MTTILYLSIKDLHKNWIEEAFSCWLWSNDYYSSDRWSDTCNVYVCTCVVYALVSVYDIEWVKHTSDHHRWNNKSWSQVAELRHNLVMVHWMFASFFFFSSIPVAIHFPWDFWQRTELGVSRSCILCMWLCVCVCSRESFVSRVSCHHTITRHSLFAQ